MNLVRRSVLKHPSGLEVKTPLLIPSFSSKGFVFPLKQKSEKAGHTFFQTKIKLPKEDNTTSGKISEVAKLIKNVSDTLTDSMLVSAYDIYHKHIPIPYENRTPDIIFLDSGGYEVGDAFDYSEIIRSDIKPNQWNLEKHTEVLETWPDYVPAVFVSYDCGFRGKPIAEQIKLAKRSLFAFKGKQLCTFLIKPIRKEEKTFNKTFTEVCNNITKLKSFDIIGIAEKDLGNSVVLVMRNIAKFRLVLDANKINIPLHIFGSLDPLTTWLYYISGAELFDSLTWLRYGYSKGQAIYYRNHGIISFGINKKEDEIKAKTIEDNLHYLSDLQLEMAGFAADGNYDIIRFNSILIKNKAEGLHRYLKRRFK